jgi:hypothetical protein
MTAHEFGDAISKVVGWSVVYLGEPDWYDLTGIDVLVALLDKYDLTAIFRDKPTLVKVAWSRNWFDKWADQSWTGMYDLILSSSDLGKVFLESEQPSAVPCTLRCPRKDVVAAGDHQGGGGGGWPGSRHIPVELLRIATNALSFQNALSDHNFETDYVFTGSYWNSPRKIMNFDPDNVKGYTGAIYGVNWDKAPVTNSFKNICRGMLDCKCYLLYIDKIDR